jgi:polyhydroxybutyrate depolymerase
MKPTRQSYHFSNSLFICIVLLALVLTACARPSAPQSPLPSPQETTNGTTPIVIKPGDYDGSIEVAGRKRAYLLHLPPSYDGKTRMPLVIVLHGGGGTAQYAQAMTGMSIKADSTGFIVVYPNGNGHLSDKNLLTWNSGNCCGYAMGHAIDDVAFIRALINELQSRLSIDATRIFATGISNGGMMCYLLACQLSDKIAAIAPVAGAMGMENCQPTQPVSAIIFHGTADEHVLFNGGKPLKQADNHPRIDKPVSFAVDFWIKANGCSAVPQKETKGNIVKETYSNGKNGSEVVLYTIEGGQHAWPGGDRGWPGGDVPTKELTATDVMWDFFVKHPKIAAVPSQSSDNSFSNRPIKQITTLIDRAAKTLDWSHKLNKLTIEKYGLDTYVDIYSINPDGTGEQCLTCNKASCPQKHNGNSAWHPSGEYIVFTSEKEKNPDYLWRDAVPGSGFNNDLWVMNADGQHFFRLTDYPLHARAVIHPHFSHDGKLLFWAERLRSAAGSGWGTWALKVADFITENGKPAIKNIQNYQPGKNRYFYESHAFSPDDTKILFTANPDGQTDSGFDIYILDLNSYQLSNLTNTPNDWDEHAQYSPDGNKIAWISATGLNIPRDSIKVNDFERGLLTELWLMNADGSNKQRLTYFNQPGYAEYMNGERVIVSDISWSPDGRTIAALIAYWSANSLKSKIVMIELR